MPRARVPRAAGLRSAELVAAARQGAAPEAPHERDAQSNYWIEHAKNPDTKLVSPEHGRKIPEHSGARPRDSGARESTAGC